MLRTTKPPPAEAVSDESLSDLQDSVQSLAHHVEVLREAVDDIREELAWALRNLDRFTDTPLHFVLKSMATDPSAPDWADRLNVRAAAVGDKPQALSDEAIDQMENRIAHIAEGQLELILSALDDLRLQLLSAVSGKPPRKKSSGVLPLAVPAEAPEPPAPEPEGDIMQEFPASPIAPAAEKSGDSDPASATAPYSQQKLLWD